MTWKYYAVASGRQTGIFQDWDIVKTLVNGYPGAIFKGFKTIEEAQHFMQPYTGSSNTVLQPTITQNSNEISVASAIPTQSQVPQVQKTIAYTDGSYKTDRSGFGVVIIYPSTQIVKGYGHVPLVVGNTNNVAELYAIYVVLSVVPEGDIDIYTDSKYSINVITGATRAYANLELISHINARMIGRKVTFNHVYGHSGIQYNEETDKLANLGVTLTNDEIVWFQAYQETGSGGGTIPT